MKVSEYINSDKVTVSFEVFPPKTDAAFEKVEKAAGGVAELNPPYMSVTYGAGGSTRGYTIKLAENIQEKYSVPVVSHLTCVGATKESISSVLSEMKEKGIENKN